MYVHGRPIMPAILPAKEVLHVKVPREFIELAHDRCGYLMRALIEGHALTSVIAEAYMQGFIDRNGIENAPDPQA